MGILRILFYAGGRVVAGLVAAFGLAWDFTGLSVLTISANNWGLIGLIAFTVFMLITLIREIDLALQQRPKIKIKWPIRDERATLEIFNDGAPATFEANFRTLMRYKNKWQPSEPYRMCWEGRGEKAHLNKEDTGVINVAKQIFFTESSVRLYLYCVDTNLEIDDWPGAIYLQITITSNPSLRKSHSNMVYQLSQNFSTKELVFVPEKRLHFIFESN